MPPISIHALLAESDAWRQWLPSGPGDFNPRSPCGERPDAVMAGCLGCLISIHALLAESDPRPFFILPRIAFISIHALLAESDLEGVPFSHDSEISIHALLAESDCFRGRALGIRGNFNPRSPCGERLGGGPGDDPGEGDFNPRSPCGERPPSGVSRRIKTGFQSTLSLRRATGTGETRDKGLIFQSTLSLRRATSG